MPTCLLINASWTALHIEAIQGGSGKGRFSLGWPSTDIPTWQGTGAGHPEGIPGRQMPLPIKQEHKSLHPIAHEKFSESLKILGQDFWKPSKNDLENKTHAAAN